MKKLLALLLAAIMVLSLAACASTATTDAPAQTTEAADTTTETAAEPAAPQAEEAPAAPVQESCQDDNARRITEFLTGLLEHMDSPAQVKVTETEKGRYSVVLEGQKLGQLIGRRGETLDALQYLTSLQIKKQTDKYVRVALNVGNYREKRQETLKNLAKKNAAYVLRTGKRYTFEPMNPYERRILHTAIQEVEGVTSRSIGVDQNRRVVLEPEGGVTNTGSDRERYNRGSRGGRRGGNRSAGSKPAAAPKADRADLPKFGKIEVPKKETPAEEAAPAAPTAE